MAFKKKANKTVNWARPHKHTSIIHNGAHIHGHTLRRTHTLAGVKLPCARIEIEWVLLAGLRLCAVSDAEEFEWKRGAKHTADTHTSTQKPPLFNNAVTVVLPVGRSRTQMRPTDEQRRPSAAYLN